MASSSFFPGLRVLFFGHGECLLWCNYCLSRSIPNMGFPSHLEVRLLARPGATLHYIAQRAPVIFRFHPHFLILHIGMFDLLSTNIDPLELEDRFWNAITLIAAYLYHSSALYIIFIGQPATPRYTEPDHMYLQRSDAFHSRLMKRGEGSHFFFIIYLDDFQQVLGSVMTAAHLPTEELLAARDSDSDDSDSGESSTLRASKRLHRPTMSVSGSSGAAATLGGNLGMDIISPPTAASVDPHLKLRIQKNLFVPFEVLVAEEQGKPIRQYLKNPFLMPVNGPKLRVFYPKMTFETWAEGLNIFMLI